ncbi:MAG: hypothetical protein Q8S02_18075 [Hydrogenophaga sp.]|nr:hypothetical protein [Hydrogenophaga sp.]
MSRGRPPKVPDAGDLAPSSRQVVTRSPGHTVRSINLPHLQQIAIEADSSLERDFVYIALAFPLLKTITHQPFQLELAAGRYTPDFLVEFKDGSKTVVEVKPESKMSGFHEKLKQAETKLAAHSIQLLLAHDTLLRRDNIEKRSKLIRRYAKGQYPAHEQALVIDLLRGATTGLSVKSLTSAGVQKVTILHMISHQKLQVSSDLDIGDDAVLYLPCLNNEEGTHAIRFAGWLDT